MSFFHFFHFISTKYFPLANINDAPFTEFEWGPVIVVITSPPGGQGGPPQVVLVIK